MSGIFQLGLKLKDAHDTIKETGMSMDIPTTMLREKKVQSKQICEVILKVLQAGDFGDPPS
ncbi:MAG: hypothetical protein IPL95_15530 [Saprospiraceae bacterium]|nr:hypothetical protein [Saprospiraceae bacterium]